MKNNLICTKEYKKKLVLIPSAYNSKVMGDIDCFIKYYKDLFDIYVIYDKKNNFIDGVKYINKNSSYAEYLKLTADYIIDAGSITGKSKVCNTQKRISVWHGTPYKKMFIDLDKTNILDALEYCDGVDLMVSPSKFYSEEFLRKSMLYQGEILETGISRTDNLYLTEKEKNDIKEKLNIPKDKKIVVYAPTYKKRGSVKLPFNPDKVIETLNTSTNDDWVIITKLHYLNKLKDHNSNIIDLTKYSDINHILSISDLLITDYSSLMFDYSILNKPILFYQYDKDDYTKTRGFMFNLEDYVDKKYIVTTEEELIEQLETIYNTKNLVKLKENFYPNQVKDSTKLLVDKLSLDTTPRKSKDIIFLVYFLNEIGGVHNFVLNLSKEFKKRFNSRIFVFGECEYASKNEKLLTFDDENIIDVKLSNEYSRKKIEYILKNTDGYIISCQFTAHRKFQKFLKDKNTILMFHGDTKKIVDRTQYGDHLDLLNNKKLYNYKTLTLLTEGNKNVLKSALVPKIKPKTSYIENFYDFSNSKNYYKKNNEFVVVSRIDKDKNIFDVLDIFANKNIDPNYKVHIYGDGKLIKEFKDEIKNKKLEGKVILHGYCDNKDEIYKDKQGLILTSLSEGFSLVVLEAMNYGIPVYLYNSFTACKEFENFNNIKLIETSNIDMFVSILNEGVNVNEKEFEILRNKYSSDTIFSKWVNLLNKIENEDQIKPDFKTLIKLKINNFKSFVKKAIKYLLKHTIFSIFDIHSKWINEIKFNLIYYSYTIKNILKKKKSPLVSIIVPFYNNISVIENLLISIKKSGYKNYEVIVINDGSKDDPKSICKKYKNVKYYYKENEGLGLTRNFGIEKATGKYIFFIDSDDTLPKGALRYLVDYAEKNKLDVVSGLVRRIKLNNKEVNYWFKKLHKGNYINDVSGRNAILSDALSTGKLYNLESLKNSNIRFEKGLYEDKLFISKVYNYYDKIGVIKYLVYNWLVYGLETSISTSHNFDNVYERIKRINNIFETANDKQKFGYYGVFINHDLCLFAKNYLFYDEKSRKELYDLYKEFFTKNKHYYLEKEVNSIYKKVLLKCLFENNFELFDKISTCVYYNFLEEELK